MKGFWTVYITAQFNKQEKFLRALAINVTNTSKLTNSMAIDKVANRMIPTIYSRVSFSQAEGHMFKIATVATFEDPYEASAFAQYLYQTFGIAWKTSYPVKIPNNFEKLRYLSAFLKANPYKSGIPVESFEWSEPFLIYNRDITKNKIREYLDKANSSTPFVLVDVLAALVPGDAVFDEINPLLGINYKLYKATIKTTKQNKTKTTIRHYMSTFNKTDHEEAFSLMTKFIKSQNIDSDCTVEYLRKC